MGEFVTKLKIMAKPEIPYFRRCCFCLPLRRGLIAWGYFKLICQIICVFAASNLLVSSIGHFVLIKQKAMLASSLDSTHGLLFLLGLFGVFYAIMGLLFHYNSRQVWMISVSGILYYVLEMVFTNVLLIGSHSKNSKVLRGYLYYMLVNLTGLVCLTIFSLVKMMDWKSYYYSLYEFLVCFTSVYIVVNIYIVFLVRSEMKKLDDSFIRFEFVNNADNSECTLNTV